MSFGLRLSLYFTLLCWALVSTSVYAMAWCGQHDAINVVVGIGPVALVGTVSTYIQWKVWQDN